MLTRFAAVLAEEQREGNLQAEEFIARIDSHIRDLETLKAWVIDSARVRSNAIGNIIGDEAPAPAAEGAPASMLEPDAEHIHALGETLDAAEAADKAKVAA